MRTIGGLPLWGWAAALGVGVVGFLWVRKNKGGTASPGTAAKSATPSFTQAQEVQDFQIFSSLTGAQQASDLNFLSEVAGLFSGGSSTAATSQSTGAPASGSSTASGTSAVPSPPSTGSTPPATTPASAGITYGAPGSNQTTTFSAPPPPGTGYVWTGTQWVVDPGQGVGYVPA